MKNACLLFPVLFICMFSYAQEYAWILDSSGVWNLDINNSNQFINNGVSLNGEELLFTSHVSDDNDYSSSKEKGELFVSRVLPNGQPQVIRRLNFYSRKFIFHVFNNHYYLLTQDLDVLGSRYNNVILEYDSTWNLMCYTRVRLPHYQHYYTDFFPLGNQQFYLLSKGTEHGSYMSHGAYLVRSGRKGRVEYKRFFALKELRNLQVRNDSIYFSTHRRTLDYSCRPYKDSVYSYTCDSMLRGNGVFKCVADFYSNGTKLPGGGRVVKNILSDNDRILLLNSQNDTLWTWVALKNWEIDRIVSVDSNRFVFSCNISENTDSCFVENSIVLLLFDQEMGLTQLWEKSIVQKKYLPLLRLKYLLYSENTNSMQICYIRESDTHGWKLCFETVFIPEKEVIKE